MLDESFMSNTSTSDQSKMGENNFYLIVKILSHLSFCKECDKSKMMNELSATLEVISSPHKCFAVKFNFFLNDIIDTLVPKKKNSFVNVL